MDYYISEMKNTLFFLLVTLLLVSCKTETKKVVIDEVVSEEISYDIIEQLSWLEGNWTNISEKSQSYENWSRKNDSTYVSLSYTTVKGDTVFIETMSLQENRDGVFMIVDVPDQNEEAITFRMISSEARIFTFENKNHDFPKRITYSNPVKDSIHAWIEGKVKGEDRKVDFYFVREN